MAKSEKTAVAFVPLGEGIDYAIDGDVLHLKVSINAEKGRPSGTGKMILTGNSGGWQMLPGGDGVRLNLMVGRRTTGI